MKGAGATWGMQTAFYVDLLMHVSDERKANYLLCGQLKPMRATETGARVPALSYVGVFGLSCGVLGVGTGGDWKSTGNQLTGVCCLLRPICRSSFFM